jgi:hypothetical protein
MVFPVGTDLFQRRGSGWILPQKRDLAGRAGEPATSTAMQPASIAVPTATTSPSRPTEPPALRPLGMAPLGQGAMQPAQAGHFLSVSRTLPVQPGFSGNLLTLEPPGGPRVAVQPGFGFFPGSNQRGGSMQTCSHTEPHQRGHCPNPSEVWCR